jgi:hypothetical protein
VGRREGRGPFGRPRRSVDEKIILKWFFKKWDGGMDWINLVQNRERRQALVNAAMAPRCTKCGELLD